MSKQQTVRSAESKSTSGIFKILLLVTVVAVIVLLGVTRFTSNKSSSTNEEHISSNVTAPDVNITEDGKKVSYVGEEGKTALELLKHHTQADTKDTSFGEQVIAINGVGQTANSFWLYYVNGEPAQVGADQYQTNDADTIEWRLE
jgi:hypothetical protein